MGSNKYIITKNKSWPVFKQDPCFSLIVCPVGCAAKQERGTTAHHSSTLQIHWPRTLDRESFHDIDYCNSPWQIDINC